jgi:hypothetical protein
MGKRSTMSRAAPNKALEPTANSVRSAPAVGGGSPRAFGGPLHFWWRVRLPIRHAYILRRM